MLTCQSCASDAVELVNSEIINFAEFNGKQVVKENYKCDYCFSTFQMHNLRTIKEVVESPFKNFMEMNYLIHDELAHMIDNLITSNDFTPEQSTMVRFFLQRLQNVTDLDHEELEQSFRKFEGK